VKNYISRHRRRVVLVALLCGFVLIGAVIFAIGFVNAWDTLADMLGNAIVEAFNEVSG